MNQLILCIMQKMNGCSGYIIRFLPTLYCKFALILSSEYLQQHSSNKVITSHMNNDQTDKIHTSFRDINNTPLKCLASA